MAETKINTQGKIERATFGAGCFWCVEAVFSSLRGVSEVQVGYCNGETPNPTYEMVCSGNSGYAEVAQIFFNPDVISFEKILERFFKTHDPTTLNKQGADVGTQYRSGIFYHSENQKKITEAGAIPLLVTLLEKGTELGKDNAAGALGNLAFNNAINQKKIT